MLGYGFFNALNTDRYVKNKFCCFIGNSKMQGLLQDFFGEDNRTRTYDPLHVKQVLYQLSYTLILTLAIISDYSLVVKGFYKIFYALVVTGS